MFLNIETVFFLEFLMKQLEIIYNIILDLAKIFFIIISCVKCPMSYNIISPKLLELGTNKF